MYDRHVFCVVYQITNYFLNVYNTVVKVISEVKKWTESISIDYIEYQ